MFRPLGAMKLGVQQKKVTASDSSKSGPHIHSFFLSQGSRVRVEMGTKSEKVCMCMWRFFVGVYSPYISKVRSHFWLKFGMVTSIYGALMLLNFCGDWGRGLGARAKLLWVSNWRKLLESKVLGICLKLSLAKKIFPQNHHRPQKIQKND